MIHKSKYTIDFLISNNVTYVFIPSYSPEIAQIKLIFGVMKRRLLKHIQKIEMKLDKRRGEREIKETNTKISKNEIIRSFDY